jgi:hypothetical protein
VPGRDDLLAEALKQFAHLSRIFPATT